MLIAGTQVRGFNSHIQGLNGARPRNAGGAGVSGPAASGRKLNRTDEQDILDLFDHDDEHPGVRTGQPRGKQASELDQMLQFDPDSDSRVVEPQSDRKLTRNPCIPGKKLSLDVGAVWRSADRPLPPGQPTPASDVQPWEGTHPKSRQGAGHIRKASTVKQARPVPAESGYTSHSPLAASGLLGEAISLAANGTVS